MCAAEILVGILLMINPVGFTRGIVILFGVLLTVLGIVSIVKYFRMEPEEAALRSSLAKGLFCVSGGCVCMFKSEWLLTAFPLITVFYGILIFISGIGKVQWAVDMLRQRQKYWFLALISAALSVIFALLILANPFSSTTILWRFIAISLIVEAIVDIFAFLFGKR